MANVVEEIAIQAGITLAVGYMKTIAKSESMKRKMKNVGKRLYDAILLAWPEFAE